MRILFQGDSITDGGRNRNDPHSVGWGYTLYASRYIMERHPDIDFEFLNFGIAGNQSSDLVGRWTTDCIEWQPDIVSIMIGVNDTWHRAHNREWLSNEQFEANYRNLLERVKNETNAKIIMMEQFLLPTDDKEYFREDINPKIMITRKLAREFADVYVPTDGLLASAYIGNEPTAFAADGVHPTAFGADYIGKIYCEYMKKIIDKML